jgi:hypothetical protein
MKVLLVRGHDKHYYRLLQSLVGALGLTVDCVSQTSIEYTIPGSYDLIFIDSSCSVLSIKGKYKHLFLFDCEDDPRHFNPGPAYLYFKDKATAYVKYTWVDNHDRPDKLKNIGFPPANFWQLKYIAEIAKETKSSVGTFLDCPVGYFSPTFIGSYKGSAVNREFLEAKSIGVWDDGIPMYNQRIDWLLDLRQKNANFRGGLVFGAKDTNMSEEWQTKYFGKGVVNLSQERISMHSYMHLLFIHKIGMNPTGHARISYRTFDLMAAGCLMLNTDFQEEKAYLMPEVGITILDHESLTEKLLNYNSSDFLELQKSSIKNIEVFLNKTPEKLYNDFIKQIG